MVDDATRKTLSGIPLLRTKAGPRDKDLWPSRLKEEYQALIKYVQNNKENDNDWFRLESNKDGTRWFGKCWYIHELLKYEFDVEFDVCTQAIPEMSVERGSKYTDTLFPRSYREVNNTSCQKDLALNANARKGSLTYGKMAAPVEVRAARFGSIESSACTARLYPSPLMLVFALDLCDDASAAAHRCQMGVVCDIRPRLAGQ
ncbi:ubiquitin-fold modifier-conjugating enzyme 1 isoform X2 [Dermacentor andersoni]|uniref:ubiquitin-fold modifier-conjugating enzyme 1 isoform X2 n=1 Tax=Dermacentor andersoni TaxID=34620 RepID=UPI0024180478|nr:ubiquitin-fold modifier-conjugating enzyme 1 isoform X2 [Dermacentor andersoni]